MTLHCCGRNVFPLRTSIPSSLCSWLYSPHYPMVFTNEVQFPLLSGQGKMQLSCPVELFSDQNSLPSYSPASFQLGRQLLSWLLSSDLSQPRQVFRHGWPWHLPKNSGCQHAFTFLHSDIFISTHSEVQMTSSHCHAVSHSALCCPPLSESTPKTHSSLAFQLRLFSFFHCLFLPSSSQCSCSFSLWFTNF